ncbi:MAG: hypothetical protein ACR2HB_05585 [Dehalococcoidia bacterium]
MAEEHEDSSQINSAAGQKSTHSQVSQTGTPTTPGGGPEPTAPTRRLNEPSVGPAGDVMAAANNQAARVEREDEAADHPQVPSTTSGSGNVVETDQEFTDDPVGHRQHVERGEAATQIERPQ